MGMEISISGPENGPERTNAVALRKIFNEIFPKDLDGKINIHHDAKLFGQAVKDIDIIIFAEFKYGFITNASTIIEKRDSDDHYEFSDRKCEQKINLYNFCCIVEVKSHDAKSIQLRNANQLWVKYDGVYHSATEQNAQQKISLRRFFNSMNAGDPFIFHLIWLRNVANEEVNNLFGKIDHNILPNEFGLADLIGLLCAQRTPRQTDGREPKLSSLYNFNNEALLQCFKKFEEIKQCPTPMTRKRLEFITSSLLNMDKQEYAKAIGKKLLMIRGRAGTGKTIKLLRIACDLSNNFERRCLLLTFNHALVSDISRTLALIDIPDGYTPDTPAVQCMTLHKFIYGFCLGIGIVPGSKGLLDRQYLDDFLPKYNEYINTLLEFCVGGALTKKDILECMNHNVYLGIWDTVLVDEGQDWKKEERDLLFHIFGFNNVIVADGLDQFVRSQARCHWKENIREVHDKSPEKRNLRQRSNLATFLNSLAESIGIPWMLEPSTVLGGGKIIITAPIYSWPIFKEESKLCIEDGNRAYEMLFLCPPSFVAKSIDDKGKEERRFKGLPLFKKEGFNLWDGTSTDIRTDYPVDINQYRLLQYDSCRGLEAWTVVCLGFDEFIDYKDRTWRDDGDDEGAMIKESPEEKKRRSLALWTLIPLTRAINTLVITLSNPDSDIGKILKELHGRFPDFIEWRITNDTLVG